MPNSCVSASPSAGAGGTALHVAPSKRSARGTDVPYSLLPPPTARQRFAAGQSIASRAPAIGDAVDDHLDPFQRSANGAELADVPTAVQSDALTQLMPERVPSSPDGSVSAVHAVPFQ